MADSYAAQVKGTYGLMPRGYPWVMLVWYAILGVLFATFMVHSLFGIAGGIVIFASGAAMVWIFQHATPRAFTADPEGIGLGIGRHGIQIPWQEIQEIRLSPAARGALADVVLLPSAPDAPPRLPPIAQVLLSVVPGSNRFLKPPLVIPLTDPIRYRAPLWRTTAEEVAEGLRPVAPDSVPIAR